MTVQVTQIVPAPAATHDITTASGRAWLESVYARDDDRYVRLNMITSLTGSAAGADGTSETLTSRTDRAILGIIRAHADVVLVGAATVRAEGYVVPSRARLAIVTASGDLSGHRLHEVPDRVVLVCPAARAETVRERAGIAHADIVAVDGGDDLEPSAILDALAQRGLHRVVCEGGPSLAARFAAARAIDEYCVSVAPALEPAEHAFLPLAHAMPTAVAGMLVDDAAFSYLRLRPRP